MNIAKKLIKRLGYQRQPGEVPLPVIAEYLTKNPIVIEAGAHVGVDTVKIAQFWPKAKVHAFEPIPNIFKQLKDNTGGLKNIKLYQLALGEKSTNAKIFISGGRSDGSSSLLKPKEHLILHPDVTFDKEIEVKIVDLDTWTKRQKVSRVDFLWLDLQGYELEALKGAQNILKKVSVIHTEVNLVEVYEGAPLYKDLKQWLEDKSFRVAFEAIDWDDGGNVLFINKNNAKLKQ